MDGFVFGPFGGGELTEEQKAEIKRRKELHEMAHEDSVRMVNELIESLDQEKLTTLKMMLMATMADERDSFAQHQVGWINARLWTKFKVCFACSKVHEEITSITDLKKEG